MIQHLNPQFKKALLELYNQVQVWLQNDYIPSHPKGGQGFPSAFQLQAHHLYCIEKLLERIINNKLIWLLQPQGRLAVTKPVSINVAQQHIN